MQPQDDKPRKGRSLHVPGVTHGTAPIPMGARVGNMIYSSAIMGKDPATNTLPADGTAQARFLFQNLRTLLAQGGSCLDDVVYARAYVRDDSLRADLNREWLACFPHEDDRPARHTVVSALPGQTLLQLEVVAVVQSAQPMESRA